MTNTHTASVPNPYKGSADGFPSFIPRKARRSTSPGPRPESGARGRRRLGFCLPPGGGRLLRRGGSDVVLSAVPIAAGRNLPVLPGGNQPHLRRFGLCNFRNTRAGLKKYRECCFGESDRKFPPDISKWRTPQKVLCGSPYAARGRRASLSRDRFANVAACRPVAHGGAPGQALVRLPDRAGGDVSPAAPPG